MYRRVRQHPESIEAKTPALDPKPRDLTTGDLKYDSTDETLFKFITEGKGPMPPWDSLSETDRRAVIEYIRRLKK